MVPPLSSLMAAGSAVVGNAASLSSLMAAGSAFLGNAAPLLSLLLTAGSAFVGNAALLSSLITVGSAFVGNAPPELLSASVKCSYLRWLLGRSHLDSSDLEEEVSSSHPWKMMPGMPKASSLNFLVTGGPSGALFL